MLSSPIKLLHSRPTNLKRPRTSKVGKLTVGNLTYHGDTVPDGIYESIRSLKTDPVVRDVASLPDLEEDYRNILDICKSGKKIPKK